MKKNPVAFNHVQTKSISTPITHQEVQVVQMLVDGKNTKEIAHELGLSHRTVENTTYKLRQKLDLRSIPELVKFMLQNNYIT